MAGERVEPSLQRVIRYGFVVKIDHAHRLRARLTLEDRQQSNERGSKRHA